MKTTIEISDELMERSRRLAARQGTTLRALVENGLRLQLNDKGRGREHKAFRMKTFRGNGMTELYVHAGLHRAIQDSYETR